MTPSAPDSDERWLLVSDVDDTLTGDDDALARLIHCWGGHRDRLVFALNSSRPYVSIRQTLHTVFPVGFEPDAVITAMGTEIRMRGEPVAEWSDRFGDWPRSAIHETVVGLGGVPHADEYQTPFKASFAVAPGEMQQRVRDALAKLHAPIQITASGQDDFDVTPPQAGKHSATQFLAEHLGFGLDRVVVAGDSGNDLAMFQSAKQAIAVGNARQELLQAMPSHAYAARAHHAAGVQEGLVHFGALPSEP